MPHIVLEIAKPVAEGENLQLLLSELNKTIGNLPSVQMKDMKTRIHILDYFCVASGNPEDGYFIHARVIQTKPRHIENQKLLSQTVLSILEKFFLKKKEIHPLQICVETTIIPDGGYLKSIHTSV